MAKSKYETHVLPFIQAIGGWARSGELEKNIAKKLGISIDTFYEYKKKYPEFADTLKKNKEIIDYEVENALLKSALSGNITAQIFWLKNRQPKQWRDKVQEESSSEETRIKSHFALMEKAFKEGDGGS